MNLEAELKKPLFFYRGRAQTLNEAIANRSHYEFSGRDVVYGSSNKAIANEGLEKLASLAEDETRQLVISRLQAVPDAKFRFLDGRTFSGLEAAKEVREHTKEGDYFVRLEKRAIEIVLNELKGRN
jgi:hypothetical protein